MNEETKTLLAAIAARRAALKQEIHKLQGEERRLSELEAQINKENDGQQPLLPALSYREAVALWQEVQL